MSVKRTKSIDPGNANSRRELPGLLMQEEATKLPRLDQLGLKRPEESLRYLRRTGQLGHVKVAGKILIPREEVVAYLKRHRVQARR